jgi:choline/glycine/proline betaine transport protein
MTVFGDAALYMIFVDELQSLAEAVQADSARALFVFLEQLPLGRVMSYIAILMVVVFFITSADSGALVTDMLASGGNPDTPVWQRIFWSLVTGAVAIALLLADGLTALQTATIASALPYSIILLVATWGRFKAIALDATKRRLRYQSLALSRPTGEGEGWQRRLRGIVMMPRRAHVERFIEEVVRPACEAVAEELQKQGFDTRVVAGEDGGVMLEVGHGEHLDFHYGVRPRAYIQPSFVMRTSDEQESRKYFRAEVYLKEGGQDYDIMGWSRDGVIGDILDQYERHRHYLHLVT